MFPSSRILQGLLILLLQTTLYNFTNISCSLLYNCVLQNNHIRTVKYRYKL